MQEQQGDEAAVALAVQRAHQRAQAAELAVPAGLPGPQPRSAAQHLPRASQASGGHKLKLLIEVTLSPALTQGILWAFQIGNISSFRGLCMMSMPMPCSCKLGSTDAVCS